MSNQHMHKQGQNLPNHEYNIGKKSYLQVHNSYMCVCVCVCDEVQVHNTALSQSWYKSS
jgi:hypothetical protein